MARKSRVVTKDEERKTPCVTHWQIGIYIRLSKEDLRNSDESESITNQRAINLAFVKETFCHEPYRIYDIYADDGRSGTTEAARPEFQRLTQDIRQGHVNCVVCKTLARAFRNYADQGKFLEQFLPACNCRFIAFGNPYVDTFANPDCTQNMEIPINGLMNDRYAARTSEDVRRTFQVKRSQGAFIGAFAPYGYIKNPWNRNAFLIDEEAASVVRLIYAKYLDGMSKHSIVRYLNEHGIPCPALYKQLHGLKYQNPHSDPVKNPLWSDRTVGQILKNQMYCGDMVQGRSRMKSYKVHIQQPVPSEQWSIVKNTHEPVIDRQTYHKVQRLLQRDTRTSPRNDTLYLFSGFLRCADCQRAMVRSEVKQIVYYYCSTYKRRSKLACTKHTLHHDKLEAAVLCAIRQQVYLAVDWAQITEQIRSADSARSRAGETANVMEQKKRELSKIIRYRQSVYQDWKDQEISQEDFRRMRDDYTQQEERLREIIRKLKEEAEKGSAGERDEPLWTELQKMNNIDRLTRDILIELVDHIVVYENGNICIVFRFADGMGR